MDRPGTRSAAEPDDPVAALYARDPDEFVAARTALVAAAKQAGDRELAKRLGALKRPTRSAWLVNLLQRDPTVAAALTELAGRLAHAHAAGDVAGVRTLSQERSRLVDDLTRRALAAGEALGYTGGEAVRAEVAGTYAAAVADPAALAAVTGGALDKAQVYAGFGFPLVAAGPAPGVASREPTPAPEVAPDARRHEAERGLEEAEAALTVAQQALTAAREADGAARAALDRASQEVADLRAELRSAEAAENAARSAATATADELHDATALVRQAESARDQAQRDLAAFGPN